MPGTGNALKTASPGRDDFVPVELNSPYSPSQIQPLSSLSDLHIDQGDHHPLLNSSRTHLQPFSHTPDMYPPEPRASPPAGPSVSNSGAASMSTPSRPLLDRADPVDQAERAEIPGLPYTGQSQNHRDSNWDIFSGVKKFEHSYQEFDTRNASEAHLVFADGDMPKNKVRRSVLTRMCLRCLTRRVQFTKLYQYLLNFSIITRWILFIVPILALLWIPGILSLTLYPKANVSGSTGVS